MTQTRKPDRDTRIVQARRREYEAKQQQAQHTPGPWETSSNSDGDWDVCGPDGGDMIADLKGCDNAEANARLIAAAPELLAALKGAEQIISVSDGHWQAALEKIRAAIAKAEEI